MILLDTNALIWIDTGHRRTRQLLRRGEPLYVSPASILELQFLHEAGKLRLRSGTVEWVTDDDRWLVDEPPSASWFLRAADVTWTRDPFDRLLVAHAQLRRWRMATADSHVLGHLETGFRIEL
jgi:PIN domain nuclease of toxin-antitoxin system